MSFPSIPRVTLSASEHRHLERLARAGAARGDGTLNLTQQKACIHVLGNGRQQPREWDASQAIYAQRSL